MTEFNRKFTQDAEKAGRQAYRRVQTDAVKAQDEHAKGVYLHWVGPSSVERIMKDFMRIDEDILAQLPRQVKFDLPLRKGTNKLERHLYDAFVRDLIILYNFFLSYILHHVLACRQRLSFASESLLT